MSDTDMTFFVEVSETNSNIMNFSSGSTEGTTLIDIRGPTALMNDDQREFAEYILLCLMLPLSIMGIVTNIINIRVYLEQGVKGDTTNIGFLALSVYDLLSCAFTIPYTLCYVAIYSMGREHYTCTAYSIYCLYVHILFQHCSAWVTAYISVVRTACVVIPLKVKLMFKPTMTTVYVLCVFFFFTVNQLMYSAFTKLKWMFHPKFNQTVAYVAGTPFSEMYLYYNSIFSNQFLPVAGLIIVSITTSLMAYKLFQVRKWRQKTMNVPAKDSSGGDDGKKPAMASKDIELIKSVTTVTSIYLVCLLMSFIPSSAVVFLPGVSMSGLNYNLFLTVYMIRFLFDSINSSINFFFYIRISTRYKEAFAASFPCCTRAVPKGK